jgi:acetate kinase
VFILTLNCRAYAIRYHLYNPTTRTVAARGSIERIELGDSFITLELPGRKANVMEADCPDVRSALDMLLQFLGSGVHRVIAGCGDIVAVAHRVAHGGERFSGTTIITPTVLDGIREASALAPLHNLPNLAGIEAAQALFPAIPHVAIFDTAFHQTMPAQAYIYPLPYEWYEQHGIRRYGFHGASHRYALLQGAELLGKEPAECNLVTVHVGYGISLCAIRNGRSIDTSMGLTPLEGATMETRSGDIDPGIATFMMQEENLSAREMDRLLNQKSGILGITGNCASRQAMLEGATDGDPRCRLALQICAYRLKKYIGAYAAVAGPLDAVVIVSATGGSDWRIRELALTGMEGFGIKLDRERNRRVAAEPVNIRADDSRVGILVLPTNEEHILATEAAALLAPAWHVSDLCA